jgi:hypothetical protein
MWGSKSRHILEQWQHAPCVIEQFDPASPIAAHSRAEHHPLDHEFTNGALVIAVGEDADV